jgi:hypothetical protein
MHGIKNPRIIGGDQDRIETLTLAATLPNMLNEWLAGDEMERLAGEPGGSPTRGKNA